MELTKHERTLLEQARRNPYSRVAMTKVLCGLFLVMLVVQVVAVWRGSADWDELVKALLFVTWGTTMYQLAMVEATAWSLVAKLDGSYSDRVPPVAKSLDLRS